jgi:hypothetical protein
LGIDVVDLSSLRMTSYDYAHANGVMTSSP